MSLPSNKYLQHLAKEFNEKERHPNLRQYDKREFPHKCSWDQVEPDIHNPDHQKKLLKGQKLYKCEDTDCGKEIWLRYPPTERTESYGINPRTQFLDLGYVWQPYIQLYIYDEKQLRPKQED